MPSFWHNQSLISCLFVPSTRVISFLYFVLMNRFYQCKVRRVPCHYHFIPHIKFINYSKYAVADSTVQTEHDNYWSLSSTVGVVPVSQYVLFMKSIKIWDHDHHHFVYIFIGAEVSFNTEKFASSNIYLSECLWWQVQKAKRQVKSDIAKLLRSKCMS